VLVDVRERWREAFAPPRGLEALVARDPAGAAGVLAEVVDVVRVRAERGDAEVEDDRGACTGEDARRARVAIDDRGGHHRDRRERGHDVADAVLTHRRERGEQREREPGEHEQRRAVAIAHGARQPRDREHEQADRQRRVEIDEEVVRAGV